MKRPLKKFAKFIFGVCASVVLFSLAFSVVTISGCSSSASTDTSKLLGGYRFSAALIRSANEASWTSTTGSQELWFYNAGVFHEISSAYVEPEFYGESVACNGTVSGTYAQNPPDASISNPDGRIYSVVMTYDKAAGITGVCRYDSRTLLVTLQPSGVIDILDGPRVQRMNRVEQLP